MVAHFNAGTKLKVSITSQGGLLKVKLPFSSNAEIPRCTRRGKISVFSNASRKRLIETFARTDYKKASIFITLTYPDDAIPEAGEERNHIRALFERLRRRYPEMSAIWKKEFEDRKSGQHIGKLVPHFHLLAFNLPFLPFAELRKMWMEIIGTETKTRVKIESCQNRRKAFYYVSKYVAKVTDAGVFEMSEQGEDVSLSMSHKCTLGRFWGIFNRDKLPLGQLDEFVMWVAPEVYYRFRREASKVYYRVKKYGTYNGFSLFVDSPPQWINLLFYHLSQSPLFIYSTDIVFSSSTAAVSVGEVGS